VHTDIAPGAFLEQRLRALPVFGDGPQHEVQGEHHGVEVEAPERLEMRARSVVGVPGDAEPPRQPLLAGRHQRFEGPTLGRARVEIGELAHGVKLVEIEPIRAQPLQGPAELGGGRLARALDGLAPEKDVPADPRHPRLEP
jgi:hypothetical protein